MGTDPFYKDHWKTIDPDRMTGYRDGFGWDALTARLFEPALIAKGQVIGDFGCGPGKIAVELARQAGAAGHVHAFDINREFLQMALGNASSSGLQGRVSVHESDGSHLPLKDGALDRICARNAIMYVDDPVATLQEFHRVLRPGGLAHAVDGDWFMMVAEPVDHDLWRRFIKAASHACRHADMGRKLHGVFKRAGFASVDVQIVAEPDVDGRLVGMIRNLAKYALASGLIDEETTTRVVREVETALSTGDYFAVSPQFVVTGRKPG